MQDCHSTVPSPSVASSLRRIAVQGAGCSTWAWVIRLEQEETPHLVFLLLHGLPGSAGLALWCFEMSGNTHTMAQHYTPEALDLHIERPTSKPHQQHEHPLITSKLAISFLGRSVWGCQMTSS